MHLRLLGSCDGCPSSSVTLELAVRDAIESAAPEVVAIEVDAPSTHDADPVAALIPVESLRTRLDTRSAAAGSPEAGAAWHPLAAADGLPPGQATTTTVADVALYACRVGAQLFVFRDGCARCAHTLDGTLPVRRLGGAADDAVLTCPRLRRALRRTPGGCRPRRPRPAPRPAAGARRRGRVSVALPARTLGVVGA